MQNYPVILKPLCETPLQPSHKRGKKRHKVGASELVAFSRIFALGFDEMREDVCVRIDGHNYEPDLAYIDKEKGICVDIEIDEPYSTSGPTHYAYAEGGNKDEARNTRFQDAGWYVIRFTEEQMFCHTKQCMKEVYKLLLDAGAIEELPKKLQNVPDLTPTPRWTEQDSWQMKHANYRKGYLGYNPLKMDFSSNLRCCMLIVPIMWRSLWNSRVRKMMCKQLWHYFVKR